MRGMTCTQRRGRSGCSEGNSGSRLGQVEGREFSTSRRWPRLVKAPTGIPRAQAQVLEGVKRTARVSKLPKSPQRRATTGCRRFVTHAAAPFYCPRAFTVPGQGFLRERVPREEESPLYLFARGRVHPELGHEVKIESFAVVQIQFRHSFLRERYRDRAVLALPCQVLGDDEYVVHVLLESKEEGDPANFALHLKDWQ